jgi:hypothetical protein
VIDLKGMGRLTVSRMDEQPILESINNKKLSKSAADGHNTIPA